MKIAIHHDTEGAFSERWIAYCTANKIPHKIVDCYSTTIISDLQDCTALMWHHNHIGYKDILCAKELMYALEHAGLKVFPDFKTSWHFDDKIGQKYLLEACSANLVPTYVFYEKKDAVNWARQTEF